MKIISFLLYVTLYYIIFNFTYLSFYDTNIIMLCVIIASSVLGLTIIHEVQNPSETNVYRRDSKLYRKRDPQKHTQVNPQENQVKPDKLDYQSSINYNEK